MKPSIDAFFLPADTAIGGQRFSVFHSPVGPARGAVVYVHPFAEEMNKSRRMAALQARALADAGFAVLQLDLHGCGDSSGDFGDATWQGWVADVAMAMRWISVRHPGPLWVWGLRAGCLLALQAASRVDMPVDLLLWQPVANGRQHLQQFLRLKAAGEMLRGGQKGVVDSLRQTLARGEPVEIAGYALSPSIAEGLDQATLELPPCIGRVVWCEVTQKAPAGLSPVAERLLADWRERGVDVDAHAVTGPAFWLTVEIETAPALISSSLAAMTASARAVAA